MRLAFSGPPTRSRPSSFCNAVADLVAKAHWGMEASMRRHYARIFLSAIFPAHILICLQCSTRLLRSARAFILSSNNPSAAADVWPKLCECDGRCQKSKECSVTKAETVWKGAGPEIATVLQCDWLPRTAAIRRREAQRLSWKAS